MQIAFTPHPTLYLMSNLAEAGTMFFDEIGRLDAKRVLLIYTAMIGEGRSLSESDLPALLSTTGAQVFPCDLADHDPTSLSWTLNNTDLCFIAGGNTYYLMHHANRSGLDAALRNRAKRRDNFAIAGESAGAIIFGTTIGHIGTMDDPTVVPTPNPDAFGWCDSRILPHRNCPFWGYGEQVDALIAADKDPDGLAIIDETELLILSNGKLRRRRS